MSKFEVKESQQEDIFETLYDSFIPDEGAGRMVRRVLVDSMVVAFMLQVEIVKYSGQQLHCPSPLAFTEMVEPVFTGQTLSVSDFLPRVNRVSDLVSSFRSVNNDWNGNGAVAPSDAVINNTLAFVGILEKGNYAFPAVEDIQIMPYGSIVMDIHVPRGVVSIEIGNSQVGYFTDFCDGENFGSEGVSFSGDNLPEGIASLLS